MWAKFGKLFQKLNIVSRRYESIHSRSLQIKVSLYPLYSLRNCLKIVVFAANFNQLFEIILLIPNSLLMSLINKTTFNKLGANDLFLNYSGDENAKSKK